MPKFRTAYDPVELYSVSGDGYEPVYTATYDDSGTLVLEKVGEKDLDAEIQSHADSVEIHNILLRYSRGEYDVLSRVQGFYEDVSSMPKTYQDVLNTVLSCEQFFDSLPVDEKTKFNNSFSEFMISLGQPDFVDRFDKSNPGPVPEDSSVSEVKDES